MPIWVALIVFGIPLILVVVLRRKNQQKYQTELDNIQQRLAAKEAEKEVEKEAESRDLSNEQKTSSD
jgi:hypothetical protein